MKLLYRLCLIMLVVLVATVSTRHTSHYTKSHDSDRPDSRTRKESQRRHHESIAKRTEDFKSNSERDSVRLFNIYKDDIRKRKDDSGVRIQDFNLKKELKDIGLFSNVAKEVSGSDKEDINNDGMSGAEVPQDIPTSSDNLSQWSNPLSRSEKSEKNLRTGTAGDDVLGGSNNIYPRDNFDLRVEPVNSPSNTNAMKSKDTGKRLGFAGAYDAMPDTISGESSKDGGLTLSMKQGETIKWHDDNVPDTGYPMISRERNITKVLDIEKRSAVSPEKTADADTNWQEHITKLLENNIAPTTNDTESNNQTAGVNRTELAAQADSNAAAGVAPTTEKPEEEPQLPDKKAAEEEHHSSLTIFFILLVVAISILVVHLLIQTKFHYLPDSIAIVLIGACIGLFLKLFKFGNWKNEEAFPPTVFFIVLLPPIIFEGGYNLHKGNFFQNIGSILVFAVLGTVISAMIVGGGIYMLGKAEVVYELDLVESFAFGSLISAVDPVATLAIFQALDVDPILYMLVFGESMLNDAVSIVLTTTMLEFASPTAVVTSGATAFFQAVGRFSFMFFGSAAIGVVFGLLSAVMTKFFDLHKTPSLEVGMVFAFSYLPYALAEGLHLSGIMAILFCGIVMSHYTHLNLSPVSQITVQQTFRTIAFIAETCVFAYLGLAIFSFRVNVKPAFTIWSIILILVGRAANIFPLSFLMNFFREHKITRKNQFIMWFSGLRGAVAFALSLHMGLENQDKQYVLVTTTLILVLFTILFLGGSTLPLLKFMQTNDKKYKKKKKSDSHLSMSKTKEMGDAIDSEHLSELTEEEEIHVIRHHVKGFLKLDAKYLIPFFTKKFTQQEMREGRSKIDNLANQWQMEVRAAPSESDGEDDSNNDIMAETSLMGNGGSGGGGNSASGGGGISNGRGMWD